MKPEQKPLKSHQMKPTSTEQEPFESKQTGGVLPSEAATLQSKRKGGNGSSKNMSIARDAAGTKHILFGRGKGYANSPGNQRMRRIVDKYRGQYIGGSRPAKRRLLINAFNEITEGGVKFLNQVGNDDEWVEVETEVALRKVGHSMRWRKGNIQESPANCGIGCRSIQNNVRTSDNSRNDRPEPGQEITEQQGIVNQQELPSAASSQLSEGALLRQAIEQQQQQQQETLNLGVPLLPYRMTSSLLVRQLELERLRSLALIERRLPTIRPAGTVMREIQTLQAIERDQELRRIIALRGDMFLGL